jgi:hypothetical protein
MAAWITRRIFLKRGWINTQESGLQVHFPKEGFVAGVGRNVNAKGTHRDKVHGRNDLEMIAQACGPELAFLIGWEQAMEITRNSAFGDLKSKFERFAVNSRPSPHRNFPKAMINVIVPKGSPEVCSFYQSGLACDRRR